MAVTEQDPIDSSVANGVTTVFPYSFKILQAVHMAVTFDNAPAVGYTLTGVGDDAGGDVVFAVPPPDGVTVVRYRDMAYARSTDFQDNGDLLADTLNDDQDAPVLMIQQLASVVDRAFVLPPGSNPPVLPSPLTPLFYWRNNAAGDGVEFVDLSAGDSSLALAAALAAPSGSALVGFIQAGTGAVPRTAQDELRERVSPTQYGAVGDDVTDDTLAFQRALNYLATLPAGGELEIPPRKYRLTAALTYAGNSLSITGAGMNNTVLRWTTASAGIQLTCTASAGYPDLSTQPVIKNLTLIATVAASGDGLRVSYTHLTGVEAYLLIDQVAVINTGVGYWTNGIHTQNVSDGVIRNSYIMLPGSNSSRCLFIDNSLTIPQFGFSVSGCSFNGAGATIQSSGWLESLYLTDSAFVGGTDILLASATGTTFGSTNLQITSCHFNAKRNAIVTNLWRSILITNSDIYSGVGTGDVAGTHLLIQNATNVQVTGCKIEAGNVSVLKSGFGLVACTGVTISGNIIKVNDTAIGLSGATGGTVNISDNIIIANNGTSAGTGIYQAAPGGDANINGNQIEGFSTGINIIGPGAVVKNNYITGATSVGITSSAAGVDARGNRMGTNGTNYSGTLRRDFVVTQSLTPGSVATGGIGATGVSLPGANFGDSVAIGYPASLGNLTGTVYINGANNGVLLISNASGSPATPPSGTYTFYVSN